MRRVIYTYITTNILSNKSYIGIHSTNTVDDNYLGSGIAILDAIKSCGRKNFKRKILIFHDSLEDAHFHEEKFIKDYNTLVPFGYNISPTGGLSPNGEHSKESKEKISNKKKDKVFTEEHKNKLRLAKLGITQSKESIEKRRSKMLGKNKGKNNGMYGKHPIPWNKGLTKETDERVEKTYNK